MQTPLRITIIGINYFPEHTGIAPYTTGLANALAANNFEITVITALPHYPSWRVKPENRSLRGLNVEDGVQVKRVSHYVPARPGFIMRFISEITFGLKSTISKWNNPDVLILISPGLFSTAISALRAKFSLKKIKVVFWAQDLYGAGLSQLKGRTISSKLLSNFEQKLLSFGEVTVIPHALFDESLVAPAKSRKKANTSVVKNWSHISEPSTQNFHVEARKLYFNNNFTVLHTGNMGAKQGLENVIKAAKLAEEKQLPIYFVLMGDGAERSHLEDLSDGLSNIQVLPPVPSDEYINVLSASDVLLLNELPGVSTMSIPSKLTSYFFAGKPVVAATSLNGTSSEEIRAAAAGIVVPAGDPLALLNAVDELRSSPDLAAAFGNSGKNYAKGNLTPEAAIEKWLSLLTSVIEGKYKRKI